ncbi:MAG: segregation/condensation protein A [Planctomycetota bacterium]
MHATPPPTPEPDAAAAAAQTALPDAAGPAATTFGASGAHRVQLDAYAGPLDLLLYLVKRHEIDLHDIPMAELVEQYLAHLRVIETIDVEQAGEFLVMAATLVEIKSRMIMPPALRGDDPQDGEDQGVDTSDAQVDPRFELVQQLLAYKRFKDAANTLEARAESWEARFPASAKAGEAADEADPEETDAASADLDLDDVNVLDLCSAFGRVMEGIGHLGNHEVTYDDTPISLHADDIADRLKRDGGDRHAMTLRSIFQGRNRGEMIGLFLATLELVRQRKVKVLRGEAAGDPDQLELQLQPEDDWLDPDRVESDAAPAWQNEDPGEVQYDWPDEASRRRAERRERRRAAILEGQETPGDPDEDALDEGSDEEPCVQPTTEQTPAQIPADSPQSDGKSADTQTVSVSQEDSAESPMPSSISSPPSDDSKRENGNRPPSPPQPPVAPPGEPEHRP